MLRLIFPFIIFTFLFFSVADSKSVFGQYRFDTWTTDNGLPQNGVREIAQTPDGYLWFTTFDGLVRFDGVRFTTYGKGNTKGIINNRFTGLFADKDGTLYATTMEDGILTVFRNGVFSSFTSEQVPGHYIQDIKPDEKGEVRFLTEDEDRTTKSWYYLRDGQFVFIEKQYSDFETKVFQGKSGAVWTITPTQTTESRNGNQTVYPLQIKPLNYQINTFEDKEGNLWLGERTVHKLGNGKVETFGEKDGLIQSHYHSFWEAKDGSLWFSSGGASTNGVGLIQYKDNKLRVWGAEDGLLGSSIFSVFHDREDTLWLATNKGLSRLRKRLISSFSTKDGIDNSEVYPLYRDRQDNVWIGTIKGLSIYRNGKFETVDLKTSVSAAPEDETWRKGRMPVQSLWEDSGGKMWVGISGGIYVVENGIARFLQKSKNHHVFAIRGDKDGTVWAATNKGLLQFRDYNFVARFGTKEGLPNEFMTTIFEDKARNLWFGGFGGLSQFNDGSFVNYGKKDGLVGNYVRSIYQDSDGVFWIGTYDEGLSRFKDGVFTSYKAEDGLSNNGVFAIEEDRYGNFWISSNRGIYRVKRKELNDFAEKKIDKINSVSYGREDGMLSNECNGGRQPASIQDKDGKIWFPTQDGVAIIDPENENYNSLPPSVVIESATVERESVETRTGLQIEPGQRNIEINFTGISLMKTQHVKFQYKLEGHDLDWIESGTRRTAYYSYLPPGSYRFLVKAANSDGVWNQNGAVLEIRMKPFFYQTVWFKLIGGIALMFVLFAVWKLSILQLKRRERKLTGIVARRTEELNKVNEELQALANSDGLTKIGNRRRFEEFLTNEWHRASRSRTEISLILVDIDHFKQFNDTYGHLEGDRCLQKVAKSLADTIKRPTDFVARFGGEEFAIILGGTDSDGAMAIAGQVLENVQNLEIIHSSSETTGRITISIGVATTFVRTEMSEADLIKAADTALYKAKENGRNQIVSFDSLTQQRSVLDEEFISVD